MANPDIQKAIRYGLDYKGMVETAGTGAIQAAGLIPVQFLGGLPTKDAIKQNVAEGQAAGQGLGDHGPVGDARLPERHLRERPLVRHARAARAGRPRARSGSRSPCRPFRWRTFLTAYSADKYALVQSYWGPDYADPNDYLVFLPGGSVSDRAAVAGFGEPGAGRSSARRPDRPRTTRLRAKLFTEIQKQLNASSPFITDAPAR